MWIKNAVLLLSESATNQFSAVGFKIARRLGPAVALWQFNPLKGSELPSVTNNAALLAS